MLQLKLIHASKMALECIIHAMEIFSLKYLKPREDPFEQFN